MPESTITMLDAIEATIEPVQVIFTGTAPTFQVEMFAGEELLLLPAHNNRLIVCTSVIGVRVVLPRAATTSLPAGFACTVVLEADTTEVLRVESEQMAGEFGVPERRAAYYSDQSMPRATFAPAFMPVTMMKTGADRWLLTGHYVP